MYGYLNIIIIICFILISKDAGIFTIPCNLQYIGESDDQARRFFCTVVFNLRTIDIY